MTVATAKELRARWEANNLDWIDHQDVNMHVELTIMKIGARFRFDFNTADGFDVFDIVAPNGCTLASYCYGDPELCLHQIDAEDKTSLALQVALVGLAEIGGLLTFDDETRKITTAAQLIEAQRNW